MGRTNAISTARNACCAFYFHTMLKAWKLGYIPFSYFMLRAVKILYISLEFSFSVKNQAAAKTILISVMHARPVVWLDRKERKEIDH